jgi:hypothetical protein
MLISEAMVMLAPYGVERIDRIPNDYANATPLWRVRQNGADYSYCCRLESLVWALTPEDEWEG